MNLTKLLRQAFLIACAGMIVATAALVTVSFGQPSVALAAPANNRMPDQDGRINPGGAIPFAVFCDTHGVSIYKINNQAMGNLTLVVDIASVLSGLHQAASTGNNVQIGSSGFISVCAVTSKQKETIQRDPSAVPYDFTFGLDSCGPLTFTLVTPVPNVYSPPIYPVAGTTTGLYTVQTGDTLLTIVLRFNVSIPALIAANNLGWNWMIYVGQQVVIPGVTGYGYAAATFQQPMPGIYPTPFAYSAALPCSSPYQVQMVDTLNIIGRRCNRSAASIAIANGIVNPN